MEAEILQWNAEEHEHWERSNDWYWGVGIIGVTIAVVVMIFDKFLFSFVVVIATAVLALQVGVKPKTLEIEISPKGIRVDSIIHTYEGIESFWVNYGSEFEKPTLILKSEKLLMPYIIIPIDNISPEKVRNFLDVIMVEEEHHEPTYHKVLEFLGF